jgi:hypothetical protein
LKFRFQGCSECKEGTEDRYIVHKLRRKREEVLGGKKKSSGEKKGLRPLEVQEIIRSGGTM